MDIRFERLNEKNQEAFFHLFDVRQFGHQQEWKSCMCRYYHTDCSFEEWINRSAEFNRQEAIREIREKRMTGILAFSGPYCIGWLNVGCILNYKRLLDQLDPAVLNKKTALSICYVIHEAFRERGVASGLLDEAIKQCEQDGFKYMVALPVDSSVRERNYRGFKQMYLNRGYKEKKRPQGDTYLIKKL